MANTENNYNPAYSTIKAIYLCKDTPNLESDLNIIRQNSECQFERIEFVEAVSDVLPNGVLLLRDTKDIISKIRSDLITKVIVEFFDSKKWELDITSVSYLNNAASDTDENFVGIYFSNKYYKLTYSTTLLEKLKTPKPQVHSIDSFVDLVKKDYFGIRGNCGASGYLDKTSNFALYKPLNTIHGREEIVSDNAIQFLNYLSHYAIDFKSKKPTFMFWTSFDGSINFKSFNYDLTKDVSYATIDQDNRRLAIFEGDAVLQPISNDSDKQYRKISFLSTNPTYQYISKNYYYIRKTPKVLDEIPNGLCGAPANTTGSDPFNTNGSNNDSPFNPNAGEGEEDLGNPFGTENENTGQQAGLTMSFSSYVYNTLAYQFQDEGQRFNIELISSGLSGNAYYLVPGSEQLVYESRYGYYDGDEPIDSETPISLESKVFGTQQPYSALNLAGITGIMHYVDNTEMWKNYFDLTPIHPHYPTGGTLEGIQTNLQKVIDSRYDSFLDGLSGSEAELAKIREIELQNFIMYSLCCMGQEESFFALLQKYETDNTKTPVGSSSMYRYKWNKIYFEGTTGLSGQSGSSGNSGSTYHQIENWKLDGFKSSETQDDTWAINLNERGMTSGYLPPGWVSSCIPTGFNYRPIGAQGSTVGTGGSIFHIVKMYKQIENGKYFYYFTAENVVDGCCP
jgi:hypothetical protein